MLEHYYDQTFANLETFTLLLPFAFCLPVPVRKASVMQRSMFCPRDYPEERRGTVAALASHCPFTFVLSLSLFPFLTSHPLVHLALVSVKRSIKRANEGHPNCSPSSLSSLPFPSLFFFLPSVLVPCLSPLALVFPSL